MMEIKSFPDRASARTAASQYLTDALRAARDAHAADGVLLLLSGGSSFEIVEGIPEEVFGPHLTISTLDERYSTEQDENHMSKLVMTSIVENATRKGVQLIDTRVQAAESLDMFAARTDVALKAWREKFPNGIVIATQGIGTDGHTAGIMPYPEDPTRFQSFFNDPTKWVIGYNAGAKDPHPERATVTLPFLREQVDESIVYVVGANKAGPLKQALAETGDIAATPARVLREMKKVTIVTDTPL